MTDRNAIVGISFVVIGAWISYLGYTASIGYITTLGSTPITAFGISVATIGAVITLVYPNSADRGVYNALVSDSIRNIELILEESNIRAKAYFLQLYGGEIRAWIPFSSPNLEKGAVPPFKLLRELDPAQAGLTTTTGNLRALLLVPPGGTLVKLAGVEKGDDPEEAVRATLVEFSGLADSVRLSVDTSRKIIRIEIEAPKISTKSPFFNSSLGSPVGSIAACVVAVVMALPVRILEETSIESTLRLRVEVIDSGLQ